MMGKYCLRALCFAIALYAGFACATNRRLAVVVGVAKYSFPAGFPDDQVLVGSENDVGLVKFYLQCLGYEENDIRTLQDDGAKRKDIIQGLTAISELGEGDEATFYFSGRGSAVPGASGALEPTILPSDMLGANSQNDIKLSVIEELYLLPAKKRGCKINVILDCCYKPLRDRPIARQWKDAPRCLPQSVRKLSGVVRKNLFSEKLSGICAIAACDGTGAAYEWKANESQSRWDGAFTDMLCNEAILTMRRNQPPRFDSLFKHCNDFFSQTSPNGYMPDEVPWQGLSSASDKALGSQRSEPHPASSMTHEIATRAANLLTERSKLRLAVDDARSSPDPNFRATVKNHFSGDKNIIVLEDGDGRAALTFEATDGHPFQAKVAGSIQDAERFKDKLSGKDVIDVLDKIGTQLRLKAATQLLWNEVDISGKASTLDVGISQQNFRLSDLAKMDYTPLDFRVNAPEGSTIYMIEEDVPTGYVGLSFPNAEAGEDQVAFELDAGKIHRSLSSKVDAGETKVLFIAIPPNTPGIRPLTATSGSNGILDNLLVVCRVLAQPKVNWTIGWSSYTIESN